MKRCTSHILVNEMKFWLSIREDNSLLLSVLVAGNELVMIDNTSSFSLFEVMERIKQYSTMTPNQLKSQAKSIH